MNEPLEEGISLPETFFEKVYTLVRLIPKGRISTYGSIGKFLSSGSSARMVGYAMNNAHHQKDFIPAHRVLNRKGYLTGKHHFGSPDFMQQLLENEGLQIEEDRVMGFKEVFWDPNLELIIVNHKIYKKS